MGCDIHSLLVVRDEMTNKVTPVVANMRIGNHTTRIEPCSFRNYFVFGLLTGGKVRDSGIDGMNIPFKGRHPCEIEESGDKATDKFVRDYMNTNGYDYHSHTYVTVNELRMLEDSLYRKLECIQKKSEKDYIESVELESAFNIISKITDYMSEVNYNLWLQESGGR